MNDNKVVVHGGNLVEGEQDLVVALEEHGGYLVKGEQALVAAVEDHGSYLVKTKPWRWRW